jgi:hypothetical protein
MATENLITLITLELARKREGDRGRTTQWRDILDDPDYPEVIVRGRRRYLVEHEHQQYLARLIERARARTRQKAAQPDLEMIPKRLERQRRFRSGP